MLCYKDRAFCSAPNCTNECGRKLTEEERKEAERLGLPICFGRFCDRPKESDDEA